jgi:hypothetical protein
MTAVGRKTLDQLDQSGDLQVNRQATWGSRLRLVRCANVNLNGLSNRLKGLEGRLLEDELYRIVWEEIENGVKDPAAQARAIEESGGDDGKVRSTYIKHRVRRIQDELAMFSVAKQKDTGQGTSGRPRQTLKKTSPQKFDSADPFDIKSWVGVLAMVALFFVAVLVAAW